MNEHVDTITIFSTPAQESEPSTSYRGARELVSNVTGRASEIAVSTVQNNFVRFIKAVDRILGSMPKSVGELTLREVEIHAEIDGKGNIGISSIAGAEIATKGGIKFVLRREM
jgi:hypothetical protein